MAENIFDDPLSGAAKSQLSAALDDSTKKLKKAQSASIADEDLSLLQKQTDVTASINSTINQLMAQLAPSGINSSDASNNEIDNMLLLANNQVKDGKRTSTSTKASKALKAEVEQLKQQVLDANKQQIDALMFRHKKKVTDAIVTYNMIIKIIPKMRLAINTLANTILSPDDFTKQSLTVSIQNANADASAINKVVARSEELLTKFNINKNIKNDIASYLINGKLIYLVLPLNREITRLLNENMQSAGVGSSYNKLDNLEYSSQVKTILNESTEIKNVKDSNILEFCKAFNFLSESVTSAALNNAAIEVDKFIENEFILGDASCLALDSSDTIQESVSFDAFNNTTRQSILNANSQVVNSQYTDSEKVEEDDIKGRKSAIVKRVSPANIIPLTFENNNYGYLHLDIVEVDPDNQVLPTDTGDNTDGMNMLPSASAAISNGSILQNIISSSKDVNINGNNANNSSKKGVENPTGGQDPIEDARLTFMANIFANKLSRKTNLKMLKRNEVLKDAIYNGLAIKKLNSNQKIRVIFLKPEEVVYIDRGQSIFDNVLFFSKLYIATLTTILMQNVLNGGDRRIVYVEVGEDNNGAQAVQQVIRDIKSKEISSVMNMDLQSVLNINSQFQDYYIPVVDGEKPISFDTMDSLANKSVDDEFLNWLSNNIFSGIGLPAAYLTEVENIDFAKSLSMQNSRYLRDCISEQAILSSGFTELLRKIYAIEYSSNANVKKKNKKSKKSESTNDNSEILNDVDTISPDDLNIILSAPSALALVNITEQINNASGVIDALVPYLNELQNVKSEDLDKVTSIVKAKLARKLVTSLDWEEYENLAKAAIAEFTENSIEASITSGDEDNTDLDVNSEEV